MLLISISQKYLLGKEFVNCVISFQALTIQEALNIDVLTSRVESRPKSAESSTREPEIERENTVQSLPPSYNMAAPLDETELMNLLTASPMYQKMENIKKMIEKGANKKQPDSKIDSKLP